MTMKAVIHYINHDGVGRHVTLDKDKMSFSDIGWLHFTFDGERRSLPTHRVLSVITAIPEVETYEA